MSYWLLGPGPTSWWVEHGGVGETAGMSTRTWCVGERGSRLRNVHRRPAGDDHPDAALVVLISAAAAVLVALEGLLYRRVRLAAWLGR